MVKRGKRGAEPYLILINMCTNISLLTTGNENYSDLYSIRAFKIQAILSMYLTEFIYGVSPCSRFLKVYIRTWCLRNQVFGTILALIFRYFSWHLIEKRSKKFGKKLVNWSVSYNKDPVRVTKSICFGIIKRNY